MWNRVTLLVVVVALGSACAAATDEDVSPIEAGELAIVDGKADGVADEYAIDGYRLNLYGDAADDLYAALHAAGLTDYRSGGLDYVLGRYVACVTNGRASACQLASRIIDEGDGDFAVTVHGARFRSAASELFGALAAASGASPASVRVVESERFICGKDSYAVWCGLRAAEGGALQLTFDGLEPLGSDFVYEGWLITEDGPVTSGRFDAPAPGEALSFDIDAALAEASTLFVLTIEPRFGDDPAPADTHVLAGAFERGSATLTVDHPAALGTDFAGARGGFILETPSTASIAGDYDQGMWFLDPAAGPGAGLDLPELPAGWVYEGWVVTDDGPLSTGRFSSTTGADEDGGGPTAGPDGTPPFPGQDFIDPAVSIVDRPVVISVEPMPDDSPAPFTIKPLFGEAFDAGAGGFQTLGNTMGDTLPSGSADFRN